MKRTVTVFYPMRCVPHAVNLFLGMTLSTPLVAFFFSAIMTWLTLRLFPVTQNIEVDD